MAAVFKFFPAEKENEWVFNVYSHWHRDLRTDLHGDSCTFYKWLKQTYNLEWYHVTNGVHLMAYNEEDWLRFVFEWCDR